MPVSVYHKANSSMLKHNFHLVQGTIFFFNNCACCFDKFEQTCFKKGRTRYFLIHFKLFYTEAYIHLTGPLK